MKKQAKYHNPESERNGVSWRHFVKVAGIAALGVSSFGLPDFSGKEVSIVVQKA